MAVGERHVIGLINVVRASAHNHLCCCSPLAGHFKDFLVSIPYNDKLPASYQSPTEFSS